MHQLIRSVFKMLLQRSRRLCGSGWSPFLASMNDHALAVDIEPTFRWHSSARLRPVFAYSIISMVHQVLRGTNEPRP